MRRANHIMGMLLGGILPKGSGSRVRRDLYLSFFRRIALAGENVWGSFQVARLN